MTDQMQIVWHNGQALTMTPSAMKELGLQAGQRINDVMLHQCIAANARAFCRDMDRRKAAGEVVPDISALAAECGHKTVS